MQTRLKYDMAKILAEKSKDDINANQVIIRYGQHSDRKKAKRAPRGNYTPWHRYLPIRGKGMSQQTSLLYDMA